MSASQRSHGIAAVYERCLEHLGFHQSPCPCLLVAPSRTEAPSIHRRYPASPVRRASPSSRRPKPVLAGFPVGTCAPPTRLPVLLPSPSSRMPPPIPRRNGSAPASLAGRSASALPFKACSASTHVAACVLAESPAGDPSSRSASVQSVTSMHRSDCFPLERQLPDEIHSRWDTMPFPRRTPAMRVRVMRTSRPWKLLL